MVIISKKIDDKIRQKTFTTMFKLGRAKIGNLPTISYTECDKLTNKFMNFDSELPEDMQTLISKLSLSLL